MRVSRRIAIGGPADGLRVAAHADGGLEAALLERFLAMGSTDYDVVACRGKGEHNTVDDPSARVIRARIEPIARPEVARKILAYVDGPALKSHPVAARMETVQVEASERY